MKKLIIVRHAHAVHDGTADFKRVLTADGQEEAGQAGKLLRKHDLLPDMILSSPAARAMQTAQKIARKLDFPEAAIVYDSEIYTADENDMLDIIRQVDDSCRTLMIVGHNPTFLHLANCLGPESIGSLPPGGIIVIGFPKGFSWSDLAAGAGASISALNFQPL